VRRTGCPLGGPTSKPVDRFGIDRTRIRFLPPNQAGDELFYIEDERHVRPDNTFQLKSIRYEAPADLHSRKIQVRYDRQRKGPPIVYDKGHRIGVARPVDFLANDRAPQSYARTSRKPNR